MRKKKLLTFTIFKKKYIISPIIVDYYRILK